MTFPPKNPDLEEAVTLFLKAIGHFGESETEKTPERVAEFWHQHLLVGTETERTLQVEGMPAESHDPVIMRDIDLHIVCPHHLTIGMGRGTLAYIPDEEWFGLGTLAKILEAATAKCTLQETATREAADLAFKLLSPKAAYVKLEFLHPCHNAHFGASSRTTVVTEAFRSKDDESKSTLESALVRADDNHGM